MLKAMEQSNVELEVRAEVFPDMGIDKGEVSKAYDEDVANIDKDEDEADEEDRVNG